MYQTTNRLTDIFNNYYYFTNKHVLVILCDGYLIHVSKLCVFNDLQLTVVQFISLFIIF